MEPGGIEEIESGGAVVGGVESPEGLPGMRKAMAPVLEELRHDEGEGELEQKRRVGGPEGCGPERGDEGGHRGEQTRDGEERRLRGDRDAEGVADIDEHVAMGVIQPRFG
jgi:hypothetical protein